MTLPDDVLALLEQPVFAFVATTFPSGQPQNTPVRSEIKRSCVKLVPTWSA